MTETTTPREAAETYDPVPDLARLLCAAQRQGHPLPGLGFVLSHLMQGLGLQPLAYSDEAEAAIRTALAGLDSNGSEDEPQMVHTHDADGAIIAVDARDNTPRGTR